jgi:hypothetical protein
MVLLDEAENHAKWISYSQDLGVSWLWKEKEDFCGAKSGLSLDWSQHFICVYPCRTTKWWI